MIIVFGPVFISENTVFVTVFKMIRLLLFYCIFITVLILKENFVEKFLTQDSVKCGAFSYVLSPRVYIYSRPRPETARHVNITKTCRKREEE